MVIESIDLQNFRNYEMLHLDLDDRVNILYGDNAQGKTNLLEAVMVGATMKSHRTSKDSELIRFSSSEAHIKMMVKEQERRTRIDMHLKKNHSKGIAVNGVPLKKGSDLYGHIHVVLFAPEDLMLIKAGPSERRRFVDSELCQLDRIYLHNLISYSRILMQKNACLKALPEHPEQKEVLEVLNGQFVTYGKAVIKARKEFIKTLSEIMVPVHEEITEKKEHLAVSYEPDVTEEGFEEKLFMMADRERFAQMSLVGPHRDDVKFSVVRSPKEEIDIRHFGSQGQQRTAALSLKLSEIELVRKKTGHHPVLLLDDVLSELDSSRQNSLLGKIHDIQTIITCTGLDEFIRNRFRIDKVFHVTSGKIS